MNTYKVLLYNGTEFVDISKLIQTNANIQDKLDLTLDFGSFTIAHAKASYTDIPGIDFSKAIKPWTPLILDINNGFEVYRFYTTNSTRTIIGKGTAKWYTHNIPVIEASKSLWSKPIPDMTITQPKGFIFTGKYYSNLKTNEQTYADGDYFSISNTNLTRDLILVNNSIDTSIINGNVLIKDEEEYTIFYTIKLYNEQFDYGTLGTKREDLDAEVVVEIYSDSTKIYESNPIYVDEGIGDVEIEVPGYAEFSDNFKLSKGAATPDATITVKVRTLGTYTVYDRYGVPTEYPDVVRANLWLTLSADKETGYPFRYLDQEVDKILDSVNLNYNTSFYLSSSTRSEIETILAPEYTFQSYTAWDALERLANFVNAIPEIGVSSFSEVSFTFLDNEPDLEYNVSNFTDETQTIIFDDYNAGYEINASNTIEEDSLDNAKVEPYVRGWMTVRINNDIVGQLTEDNAAFKTRQRIFKIYKMFIKGVTVTITDTDGNNPITISSNVNSDYWDISDLVVEKQRWDTFENGTANKNDYYRTTKDTKGNHIYYVQGTNFVQGLNYKTTMLSDFFGQNIPPRALMEVIMRAAAQYLIDNPEEYPGYIVKKATALEADKGESAIVGDHKLFTGVLAQIHYAPMANIRSTVYKHNAFSLGVDTVKFLNEQDKLNDTLNLGEYTRKTINKLGNTIYTVSGRAKNYLDVPRLGYKTNDGKIILTRNVNLNKNLITYDLELSENFLNQSTYVGVNSAYRQYEVPVDNIVHRQDKHQEFVLLTTDKNNLLPNDTNFETYGKRMIVHNFQDQTTLYVQNPISYGKMTITKQLNSTEPDNVKSFDMPINGISLGTTINLQLEMNDNYSAGPRIDDKQEIETVISTLDDFFLQNYSGYTDTFGNIYSYDLQLRQRGTIDNDEDDANMYPFHDLDNYNTYDGVLFNLSNVNIRKDAREKYGLNIQLPVLSTQDDIHVFPGFAKYSAMIRDKDNMNLAFATLSNGYFPNINALKVDRNRINILQSGEYIAGYAYDLTNEVYGLNYNDILVKANSKIQGFVVFESTTNELILAINHPVDRTGLSATYYDFPTIWAIHKKSLNTYMYPDEPERFSVSFVENGGVEVPNQFIYDGDLATAPSIYREGYTLEGWYSDILLTIPFTFDTPITNNIVLYAKWESLIAVDHTWQRVYTTSSDTTIYPETGTYSCPINYATYLPDANNYNTDFIISIQPVRLCNPQIEICFVDSVTQESIASCETRYYKVVEV